MAGRSKSAVSTASPSAGVGAGDDYLVPACLRHGRIGLEAAAVRVEFLAAGEHEREYETDDLAGKDHTNAPVVGRSCVLTQIATRSS